MLPFHAPTQDILFSLEHMARASGLPDWDAALSHKLAGHFATCAQNEIAPIGETGDLQGCTLTDGCVTMPAGFAAAYKAYCDQGWPGLTAPDEYGGQDLNTAVLAITSEIFPGACHRRVP